MRDTYTSKDFPNNFLEHEFFIQGEEWNNQTGVGTARQHSEIERCLWNGVAALCPNFARNLLCIQKLINEMGLLYLENIIMDDKSLPAKVYPEV